MNYVCISFCDKLCLPESVVPVLTRKTVHDLRETCFMKVNAIRLLFKAAIPFCVIAITMLLGHMS
jgi:hypothetical protein